MDNRASNTTQDAQTPTTVMDTSIHKPPIVKKRHNKKLPGNKEKRPRKDSPPSSEETQTKSATGSENDHTTVPKDPVVIAPEILKAIKLSLKDDLLQICQQACQQVLDNKDSQSSTSSISQSPRLLPPRINPPKGETIRTSGASNLGRLRLLENTNSIIHLIIQTMKMRGLQTRKRINSMKKIRIVNHSPVQRIKNRKNRKTTLHAFLIRKTISTS